MPARPDRLGMLAAAVPPSRCRRQPFNSWLWLQIEPMTVRSKRGCGADQSWSANGPIGYCGARSLAKAPTQWDSRRDRPVQEVREGRTTAANAAFQGARRDSGILGDLLVGEALDLGQQEHLARRARQLAKSAEKLTQGKADFLGRRTGRCVHDILVDVDGQTVAAEFRHEFVALNAE